MILECLNDDALRYIIPFLELKDRLNFSSACRRVYKLETEAGKSKVREKWHRLKLNISRNELLVNKIRRHVNDDNPRTIFTTPPVSVVAKIIRTTRIEILVIEIDLENSSQRSSLAIIAAIEPVHVIIIHEVPFGQYERRKFAYISPDLFSEIPPSVRKLDFSGIRIDTDDIERLYASVKQKSISSITFRIVPIKDVIVFANKLFGIQIVFPLLNVHEMSITINQGSVYYKNEYIFEINDHKFFLKDGLFYTTVTLSEDSDSENITFAYRQYSRNSDHDDALRIPFYAERET